MTDVWDAGWDVLRAELTDTMRGQHSARQARHCVYCGRLTKSVYRVCLDHTDLIKLDPSAPAAALEDTRAAQSPDADGLPQGLASPTALVSSSATNHAPPDMGNGDGQSGAVALDSSAIKEGN